MSNLSAAFFLFEAASNTEIDDKRFYVVDQSSPDYIHHRLISLRTKQVFQALNQGEDTFQTRYNLTRIWYMYIWAWPLPRIWCPEFCENTSCKLLLQIALVFSRAAVSSFALYMEIPFAYSLMNSHNIWWYLEISNVFICLHIAITLFTCKMRLILEAYAEAILWKWHQNAGFIKPKYLALYH